MVVGGSTVVVTLLGSVFVPSFATTSGTTLHNITKSTGATPARTTTRTPPKGTSTTENAGQGTMTTGGTGSTTATEDGFDSTMTLELTTTVHQTQTGAVEAPAQTTTSSAATTSGIKTAWVTLLVAMTVVRSVTCF